MEIDYLIRKDDKAKVYLTESTIDVISLLKENYSYIYEAVGDEGFIIKSHECNLFKEIVYDGKVVGFCSYDFQREFMTAALNNIYILKEFRGNGLFLKELKRTMEEHTKPSIIEPTRKVVDLLVKYGFASKISKNITASAIEFIIPGTHLISNKKLEAEEELSTHFYDVNICACIHFLDIANCHIVYSSPLNEDIRHYDCLEKRMGIDDDYFKDMKELFIRKEDEIMLTLVDLEEHLPVVKPTLEEVIGREGELSDYIESLVDDAHVSYVQALKIKNQIKEEYESGMILNESLLIRLEYLFMQPEKPSLITHKETCPYCNMPTDNHDRFCHFCGINLNYDIEREKKHLIKSLQFDHEKSGDEDIRYIAYKFLKMLGENIEFEYAIFMVENNYNIHFSQLNNYLKQNSYLANEKITPQGLKFMKNHPLYYYEKYELDLLNYNEFEKYFYEHSYLTGEEICLKFLDKFDDDEVNELKSEIYNK